MSSASLRAERPRRTAARATRESASAVDGRQPFHARPARPPLKVLLDSFLAAARPEQRIPFDPVELPRQYERPQDIEVAGLISASLAYGRADLFKPKVAALLSSMGSSPAEFVAHASTADLERILKNFVYRFNVGSDIAVLLKGIGSALEAHASLENLYRSCLRNSTDVHGALSQFTETLRRVPMAPIRRALGRERGLNHLLPTPLGPGAAKRLNLFLRWMVRGPDSVDFGIWRTISPAELVIPLDVHIGRISRYLGLTRRNDLSWKTAVEITEALRLLDPDDPIKYDFALCHYGMSGICPAKPIVENCARCLLASACAIGRRKRVSLS